tara:strand:- start:1 stop:666 length:666 start_codon:yes stop_codon:yes gene_type:complete
LNSTDLTSYPHPIIAKEGWPFIGANLFLIFISYLSGVAWITWFLCILLVFVFQFFRDPSRVTSADQNTICSPADGRVVFVGSVKDPYNDKQSLKISIFMNVFNVHSNRSPISGHIERVNYIPGNFFNADLDKASESNERNSIVITDGKGRSLTCVQIAGLVARRICCYVAPKDEVKRGQRIGFIRFGSRVDIYLPEKSSPMVTVGDKIYAHSTSLAMWPKN